MSALAQGQQATPALKIVTDDPNLPSDLYYGNTKIRPLRVRPGTNKRVTIDDNDFFIQQHFIDFLGRLPDVASFTQRLYALKNCAPGNTSCDRIAASQSFFSSDEFQGRGLLVYKLFMTSFARKPNYKEFILNVRQITPHQTAQQLEASKVAFINNWLTKPAFKAKYDRLGPAAYVDALSAAAKVTLANRNTLIAGLEAGTKTRAQVLRAIAESREVNNRYYNESFVVMGYFGYYRRDPDTKAAQIITQLNATQDYRATINSFLSSPSYHARF
jgi:hypothetical protein